MSVSTRDIFDSACKIQAAASCEGDHRSALSRFYYAAYHTALQYHQSLPKPGLCSPKGGVHDNLIHQLDHPSIDSADPDYLRSKELGRLVLGLKLKRTLADYQLDKNCTLNDALTGKSQAELILQKY